MNLKKYTKGQSLPMNTIVIAILVIIVLLIIVVFFISKMNDNNEQINNVNPTSCNDKNPVLSGYSAVEEKGDHASCEDKGDGWSNYLPIPGCCVKE